VARELHSTALVCTLGNHDVASRSMGGDPFASAKRVHLDFPLEHVLSDQFWAQGFCIKDLGASADVVVINTAYHHYSEKEARSGTFPDSQLVRLDEVLTGRPSPPIRIALLHHHPVLHSFAGFDSADVLPTGDELIRVLAKHRCHMVIHGHKHHPRLHRELVGTTSIFVLASGSLSAYLNELGSRTRNVFHLATIEVPPAGGLTGTVRTWEFNYARGWNPTSIISSEFPHEARFGPFPATGLGARICNGLRTETASWVAQARLRSLFPELDALIPEELQSLARDIAQSADFRLEFDDRGTISGVGRIVSDGT